MPRSRPQASRAPRSASSPPAATAPSAASCSTSRGATCGPRLSRAACCATNSPSAGAAGLMQQPDEAARYAKAREPGDFDPAAVIAGEAVDLIGDIPPAAEIVERMTKEASTLLAGASNRYRAG